MSIYACKNGVSSRTFSRMEARRIENDYFLTFRSQLHRASTGKLLENGSNRENHSSSESSPTEVVADLKFWEKRWDLILFRI